MVKAIRVRSDFYFASQSPQRDFLLLPLKLLPQNTNKNYLVCCSREHTLAFTKGFWVKMCGIYTTMVTLVFLLAYLFCSSLKLFFFFFFGKALLPQDSCEGKFPCKWPFWKLLQALFRWLLFFCVCPPFLLSKLLKSASRHHTHKVLLSFSFCQVNLLCGVYFYKSADLAHFL